jgi:hypothetical protein
MTPFCLRHRGVPSMFGKYLSDPLNSFFGLRAGGKSTMQAFA